MGEVCNNSFGDESLTMGRAQVKRSDIIYETNHWFSWLHRNILIGPSGL
jgi:hypothetical protein